MSFGRRNQTCDGILLGFFVFYYHVLLIYAYLVCIGLQQESVLINILFGLYYEYVYDK